MVSLFNMLLSMASIILILSSLFSYNYGFFKAALAHSITIPVRGDSPLGIAYNPANSNMYVANLGSSTVSVINSSTDSVTSSILVGRGPAFIAHAPLSNKLYVTSGYHNDVYVINGTTNKVIKNILVSTSGAPIPWGIAYNPSNNNVYVANAGNATVSVINTSTDTVVGTIAFILPVFPLFLTYDSSNQGMYLSTGTGGQGNIKVSIINTATDAHVGDTFLPAGVDSRTMELAYNRNNNLIYATAFDTSSIFTLNPDTNKFEGNPIPVGSRPIGIIHNPSNNYMYVTNYDSDTVSVIDATRNSVVATLPTGDHPSGIAYNPNNRHIYVANTGSNTVSIIHP